jgi:hypothetical protein
MAAIASTLQADFSDFVTETQKANAAMKAMQAEAHGVSSAVAGTASDLDKVGGAASSSTGGVNSLSTSLRTADKTLGAFGVQIGPTISAIEEMEGVAGKTAAELGILGGAISVAGAALAGWNIGRWIAEMTGADAAISEWAATMMGLPSLSQQTAGAIQDVIDKAQKAGYAGHDYAGAIKFVTAAEKDRQATLISGERLIGTWTRQLEEARGGAASLKQEIEAGNMTHQQMADKYRVSVEAVKFLQRTVDEETKARNASQAAIKAQGAAIDEMNAALQGQDAILETLTASQRGSIEAALEAGVSQSTVAKAYGLTAVQVRAVADAMKEAKDAATAFEAAQKLITDANNKWNEEIVSRSATTTGALIADVEQWRTEQYAALEATGAATQAMYDKIDGIAAEKLAKITVNWNTLKDGAIASFADQAARAEATYQEMLADSNAFTAEAIRNAQRLATETATAFEQAAASHDTVLQNQLKREGAYNAAVAEFREEADTAAEKAAAARDAALDRAIAYANTYGVTIEAAQKALGQMGDAGKKAGDDTKAAVEGANQAIGQTVQLATQSSAALREQARFYSEMARENMQAADGRTTIGWSPFQMGQNYQKTAENLRTRAAKAYNYEQAGPGGTPWARNPGMTMTVTVNNADAQGIANKLVEEMRHAGMRFG